MKCNNNNIQLNIYPLFSWKKTTLLLTANIWSGVGQITWQIKSILYGHNVIWRLCHILAIWTFNMSNPTWAGQLQQQLVTVHSTSIQPPPVLCDHLYCVLMQLNSQYNFQCLIYIFCCFCCQTMEGVWNSVLNVVHKHYVSQHSVWSYCTAVIKSLFYMCNVIWHNQHKSRLMTTAVLCILLYWHLK